MNPNQPQKKRGEISVHKAFGIIYFLIFIAIVFGPLTLVDDETDRALTTFSILINGGLLLIIGGIILHVFLALRDKRKR